MNKIKMLLLVMVIALLFAACNKPEETPTTGPSEETAATEQMTEATEPETNLPGVEENQFSEDEIEMPTEPVNVNNGSGSESGKNEGGETNTGNGNSGNGNSGSGNSGNGNSGSGNSGNGGSDSQGNSGSQGNTGSADKPTQPAEPGELVYVSYEEYNNMSPEEQVAYFNQFPSMEAFVEWYNEAKAEYDEENGAIDIGGDGSVDLGGIVNP